jgi:hypothetical protein
MKIRDVNAVFHDRRQPGRSRFVLGLLALLLGGLAAAPALAQNASMVPACPEGNLLAHRMPVLWQEVRRELSLLTDEKVAPEGAVWDAAPAVILETGVAAVTWDLGAVTLLRSFAVQADANDTYTVWGSVDGKDYKVLGQIDPVSSHGLRTRVLNVGGMPARFVRIGEGVGDNFYSIAEVTAYCQVPTPFPPAMKVVDAPAAVAPPKPFFEWNNDTSGRWELVLALLGLAFLWWERKLSTTGRAAVKRRLRAAIVGVLGVLAFLTYFNFGSFHFPNFIHGWDTFHYYIGSKYFKELRYERLYECVAVADSEEPTLRRRVELRKMTNLRTNVVETTADILAHPERCKQHFSDVRWASFKNDLRYFRTLENARRWDDAQTDHGYNGTPVWNIAGTLLANLAPASRTQIFLLDSIDVGLVLLLSLLVWWAFGWRVLTVALLAFATNFPSRWYWTGGSMLRWDWLFWMTAAVCLLKKERFFYAGMALAYSTLLRIFPGFMFVAPLLAAVYHAIKHREIERRYLRFFMGAAVAVAILVPLSVVTAGGADAYPQFVRNTVKHAETPLTNYMGLRTVVDYRPSEVGRLVRNDKLVDPWRPWKDARLKSFSEARPLYIAIIIGYLVILGLAVRGVDPWVATALSATMIAFGAELTCYYYAFILVVALLYAKHEVAGRWLLGVTAFTQFIGWAPIQGLPTWMGKILPSSMRGPNAASFGMPTGLDEQYTWMSLATLVGFTAIAWEMMAARRAALAPAGVEVEAKAATGPLSGEEEALPAEAKAAQPVWRARLERRTQGGKKKKHR